MKTLLKTWRNASSKTQRASRIALGLAVGALIGLGIHWLIGCPTGGCPITSDPVVSALWGAAIGGLSLGTA